METKKCSKCGEVKELSEYYGNSVFARCKKCIKNQNDNKYIPKPKQIKPKVKNGYKICSRCKIEKKINEFHKNSFLFDGVNHICKLCVKEYSSKRYPKKEVPFYGDGLSYCSECKSIKKLSEFFLIGKSVSRCKECRKKYNRNYATKRRAKQKQISDK